MSGWDRLARVTGPAVSPLSLEDAKSHLKVETTAENADIGAMIAAAVAMVDGPRGRGFCLVEQTWRLSLDAFVRHIAIPLGPNVAIVSVKYIDGDGAEQTVDPGDYQLAADLDPAVLSPTYGTCWPSARCEPGAVRIEFKAGWAEADLATKFPADLLGALKLVVGSLYKDREAGGIPAAADAVFNRYGVLGVA